MIAKLSHCFIRTYKQNAIPGRFYLTLAPELRTLSILNEKGTL